MLRARLPPSPPSGSAIMIELPLQSRSACGERRGRRSAIAGGRRRSRRSPSPRRPRRLRRRRPRRRFPGVIPRNLELDRSLADHCAQTADLIDRGRVQLSARRSPGRPTSPGPDRPRSSIYSITPAGVAGFIATPAFSAERPDQLQRAVEVRAGLDVHGDEVGRRPRRTPRCRYRPAGSSGGPRTVRRMRPQRLDDLRPERDVGHEVAVHDVDVDAVGAGRVDRAHLLAEPGEVGGEDRGRDLERAAIG